MVLMKQPSPYSLMYLVTPAIYEKLLLCLDEGDKRLLDSLNKPKSDEVKRPSEEIADIITSSEVAQSGNFNTSLVGDEAPTRLSFTQPIHYGTPVKQIQQPIVAPPPVIPPPVVPPPPVVQPPVVVQPQVVPQQIAIPVPPPVPPINPPPARIIQPQILQQPVNVDLQQARQAVVGPPIIMNNPPLPRRIIERNQMFAEMDKIRRATVPGPPAQFQRSSTPIDASMHSDFTFIDPESNEPSFEVIDQPEKIYPAMKKWDGKRKRDDFPVPPSKRRDHELHLARDERYHADRLKRRQNRFMQGDPYFQSDNVDPVEWQPYDPNADVPFRTPQQCVTTTTGGRICQPQPAQPTYRPLPARMRERYQKLKELDSKIKQRKSRFAPVDSDDADEGGSDIEPFQYDPSKDVPFRKPKAKIKRVINKPKSFRCGLCQTSLATLYALKNHITKVHHRDPNEVISDMATQMLARPGQGSSSDFTDWNALRVQPRRGAREKKNQGGKGKKFRHWL